MIHINFFSALLFVAGSLSLFLALFALNIRQSRLIHLFALFAGCVAVYAFGYGLELMSRNLGAMLFWSKVQYLGVSFIPGLILAIAMSYTGKPDAPGRVSLGVIFLIPVIVFWARVSNSFHHLFYASAQMVASDFGALMIIEPGPLYFVHAFYSNAAWVISFGLLLGFYFKTGGTYKRQILIISIGSAIQWLGYLAYLTGAGPEGLDLNPLLLCLTVPVYALGFVRFSLFRLVPVARDKVFEEMRDGIVVANHDLRLVDFNRKSAQLFPRLVRNNMGRSVIDLFADHPEVSKVFESPSPEDIEVVLESSTGPLVFRLSHGPLHGKDGTKIGRILTLTEITAQKQFMDKLEKLATIDELTGIYNRRQFRALSKIELIRYGRNQRPAAVLLMDLDHFKAVNDTWGHQCGDQVLQTFTLAVKQDIRAVDIFGRMGGEEFMVFMPETPEPMALKTARRICRLTADLSMACEGKRVAFTVSIGVGGTWGLPEGEFSTRGLETMIRMADKALYTAKQNGRNQAVTG